MQYYKGKLPNSQTRPKQDKRNQIKQKKLCFNAIPMAPDTLPL